MAAANAHHRAALGLSLGPLGVSALATEEGDIGKNKDRHRDDHVDGGALTHGSGTLWRLPGGR
jgi:hypothetical protein